MLLHCNLQTVEYRKVGGGETQNSNASIIAATNREPAYAIGSKLFHGDLDYRLTQFPIKAPRLRDNEGGIVGLAMHFLAHSNSEEDCSKEFSIDAIAKIGNHG